MVRKGRAKRSVIKGQRFVQTAGGEGKIVCGAILEKHVDVWMQNSRHTFQSWRDHWIKDLSTRPRPTLPEAGGDEDDEDEPSEDDGPKFRQPVRQQYVAQVAKVSRNAAPASSSTSRVSQSRNMIERKPVGKSSPTHSSPVKPTAGNNFTDEDTELLDGVYGDILNLDEDQIIDAWVAWAENVRLSSTFKYVLRLKLHSIHSTPRKNGGTISKNT